MLFVTECFKVIIFAMTVGITLPLRLCHMLEHNLFFLLPQFCKSNKSLFIMPNENT